MEKECLDGLVRKGVGGFYTVETSQGDCVCTARGKFRKKRISPYAGDRVRITAEGDGTGALEEILPRKNFLARPPIANIDQLFIVSSLRDPYPEPLIIDKTIAVAEMMDIRPVLVLTKTDLDDPSELKAIYDLAGVPCLVVSSKTGDGVNQVRQLLRGKISAFTGNSGVGKSSILNALYPGFDLQVAQVSEKLGRGRHTTRHVELFAADSGFVIDTPGFSSFDVEQMEHIGAENLANTFREFRPYLDECRFVGCTHTKEKGCAVLAALKDGKIAASRHASYIRLYQQAKEIKPWQQR